MFFSMQQCHRVLPTFFKNLVLPERKFRYLGVPLPSQSVLQRVTRKYTKWSTAIGWSSGLPHLQCLLKKSLWSKASLAILTYPPLQVISHNTSNKTIVLSLWEELQWIVPGVKLTYSVYLLYDLGVNYFASWSISFPVCKIGTLITSKVDHENKMISFI